MSYGTSQPYIASYVLLKQEGKFAFVLRGENTKWMQGFYSLPSGKIEVNEAASAAAIREAKEEVGISIKPDKLRHVLTMQRNDAGNTYQEWVDFFFEATGWEGVVHNAEPHMHDAVAWFTLDELPKNIVPNVRAAFEAIQKGTTFTEFGWH